MEANNIYKKTSQMGQAYNYVIVQNKANSKIDKICEYIHKQCIICKTGTVK